MLFRSDPGHLTASAVLDVAEPAGIDDCGETDDDDAAKNSSIIFACAGAACIRDSGVRSVWVRRRRSGLKSLNREKFSKAPFKAARR